jgi:hypothetical protein
MSFFSELFHLGRRFEDTDGRKPENILVKDSTPDNADGAGSMPLPEQFAKSSIRRSSAAREVADALIKNLAAENPDAAFLDSEPLRDDCRRNGVQFSASLRSCYDRKVRVYALASLHCAIRTVQESSPEVGLLATALIDLAADVPQHEVEQAMALLGELCSPGYRRQMTWAKDWLRDVGIALGNPIEQFRFSHYWGITCASDLQTINVVAEKSAELGIRD